MYGLHVALLWLAITILGIVNLTFVDYDYQEHLPIYLPQPIDIKVISINSVNQTSGKAF